MQAETIEADWLDLHGTVNQAELERTCRLIASEVAELVEYGLLTPAGGTPGQWSFSAACVQPLRQAAALRSRFDLDIFVLGLMFSQLERIEHLERQLRSLHVHQPPGRPPREGPAPWREPHG